MRLRPVVVSIALAVGLGVVGRRRVLRAAGRLGTGVLVLRALQRLARTVERSSSSLGLD